jgi:hypothetical protein
VVFFQGTFTPKEPGSVQVSVGVRSPPPTKVKFVQVSVTVHCPRLLTVRWKGSVFAGSFQSEKLREISGGDRLKVSAREDKVRSRQANNSNAADVPRNTGSGAEMAIAADLSRWAALYPGEDSTSEPSVSVKGCSALRLSV